MPLGAGRFNRSTASGGGSGNTALLLKFEGSGTTLLDSSNYARSGVAISGDAPLAVQDGSLVKFGSKALNNISGTTRVRCDVSTADTLGDFTLEAWVFKAGYTPGGFAGFFTGVSPTLFYPDLNGNFRVEANNASASVALASSLASGAWVHLCVQRNSNVFRLFFDGALQATIDNASLYGPVSLNGHWEFGSLSVNNYRIAESMDELRLSSVARYGIVGFTPPAAAFTAD